MQGLQRQHERLCGSPGLHRHRQGHVFAQKSGQCSIQRQLDLYRAPLRIYAGGNGHHPGHQWLVSKRIRYDLRALPLAQLIQKTFIHLRHDQSGPLQRQLQQRRSGLHDLPRFHIAQQHLALAGCRDAGLVELCTGHRQRGLCLPGLRLCRLEFCAAIGRGCCLCLRCLQLRLCNLQCLALFVQRSLAQKALLHQFLIAHPV